MPEEKPRPGTNGQKQKVIGPSFGWTGTTHDAHLTTNAQSRIAASLAGIGVRCGDTGRGISMSQTPWARRLGDVSTISRAPISMSLASLPVRDPFSFSHALFAPQVNPLFV